MRDVKILKIAKFVRRLYKLVSDDSYPEIQWTEDGKSFFVSDKNLFLKSGLKTLSKTSEYSAFVRQLYVYGFSKSKSMNAVEEEYYHSNFQKGGEQMLPCIKRIVDKNTSLMQQNNFGKPPNRLQDLLQYLNSKNHKLENDVKSLQERVDKQECKINGLVEILSRMFRVNGDQNISMPSNTENNNIVHESWELQNYLQNHHPNTHTTRPERGNFLYSSDEEDSFYNTDIF
ncbi:hypothetical protein P3W45_000255 [Vairimorpha bombi]|jgi:hypothetical protein